MDALRVRTWRFVFSIGLLALLVLQTGCYDFVTDFTYGKSADKSINGVSVFANLLRDRGHSVSRKRRLTNRFDRYDTVVWTPDNKAHPPEKVVAWLEQWLAKGDPRVLIFVGRSYDGKRPYYQGKFDTATPEAREGWQRELAEEIMRNREFTYDWGTNSGDPTTTFWYEKDENVKVDATKIGGPWAEDIDSNRIDLKCQSLLKPLALEDYNDNDEVPQLPVEFDEDGQSGYFDDDYWVEEFREDEITVKELLTVDGKPFAFEISTATTPGRKVIIISNGSFLLNYPLVKPENRKLAAKVADEVTGDVVFLESGYSWPSIGGSGNDPALHWTWVGQAPMNYIVPHFLFWGVLYCFVFYPNFGRPKRIQFHPPKAFQSHVKAVAAILGRSKEKNWARQVVDLWLKRNNRTKQ